MWSFLVFLLGLAVGSFLNVCIHRIPRGESIVSPRSYCPQCKASIKPYDNIPLISYILLGGRCRNCKSRISLLYPLVELLTGLLMLACYDRWGFSRHFAANALFVCLIIPLMFIDFYHYILPDVITIPGIIVGFFLSPLRGGGYWGDPLTLAIYNFLGVHADAPVLRSLLGSLLGLLVGGGTLWLVGELYYWLRRVEGLGLGDVKMMAMVGAFLGWQLALLTIFLGSIGGSLLGVYLIVAKGKGLRHALYYGTFLGMGSILSLFYGHQILEWYSSYLRR